MAQINRLSKSKIGTYEACPYNYKLCYVDKLPMPKKPWAMSRGVDIHDIYDEIVKGKFGIKITDAINSALKKHPEHFEAIKNFELFHKAISTNGNIVKPLMAEEKLYDSEIDVVGIVDAVYEVDNKKILIDYKSGNINSLNKYTFELGVYAYLVKKIKNIELDKWGIYFTDHHIIKLENIDKQQIDFSLMKINTIRNKIENNEFPKKHKYPCKNCMSFMNGHCGGK